MTTTYTRSLASDFGGSFKHSQFHREIVDEAGITPILDGINVSGDVIDIIFDSSLSVGEQTTLDTLISNHVPSTNKEKVIFFSFVPPSRNTNLSVYHRIATFKYNGSDNIGPIDYIEILGCSDADVTSYDVRVVNALTMDTIAEKTGISNTVSTITDLGTISNIPTDESIFEVYVKKVGGSETSNVHIEEITVYHNNTVEN